MIKIYPRQIKTMRNKSKSVLLTLMLLMSTTVVLADPGTGLCDGVDGGPDNCPLDTWVWALIAIVTIFAVTHLKRKRRQISDQ
ncbi:hypothetical protein ACPPVU_16795 [Mucilaginibacter sp. McL0603]|uniref:hypothetical protein n=1 Tax=Mucilaginibacter sp. McL0603 TaxID=3415670 RepID=UPI003CE70EA7